ncbi:MAG: Gfo/Idh/MocA family oxidoreductase [Mariniblastus sp.]|nr:Gfo/Idh/MocA family oxidoreductase [Mariniblastus sp.]
MTKKHDDRRDFLKKSVAAGTAASMPYFFSSPKLLGDETKAKNDRIPIGLIGAGGMGNGNMRAARDWVDVVAIADVDKGRLESSNKNLSKGKADTYRDYQKVLERDDIKVIHVATPDHWHTKPLVEAMLAGKDVYCEKPMTLTIDEGKLIRKVQKETGRIVQVGTQQRSTFNLFTKAIAMVAEGRVGKIRKITCNIGGAPTSPSIPVADVPGNLDWDRWLGPAPKVDYRNLPAEGKRGRGKTNCHYEFRWWYEYSGGKLTDWGAHHVDIANWALKANGQLDGPVSIGGTAEHPCQYKDGYPVANDCYNTATSFNFSVKYANGTEIAIANKTKDGNGVLIEGDKGRFFVSRGKLAGKPFEDLANNPLPEDAVQKVYKGLPMEFNERKAHWANFLDCHRKQVEPISDVHSHMQMLNICHLAGISARLGRTLRWDDENEQILSDDQANSFLKRDYRKGYEIAQG